MAMLLNPKRLRPLNHKQRSVNLRSRQLAEQLNTNEQYCQVNYNSVNRKPSEERRKIIHE
jgi:hypothetical protein